MSYITDNPWPVIILLIGVAVAAFASGVSQGSKISAGCLLLAVCVYFVEQSLVSEAEAVEIEIRLMLENFKSRNLDAITAQICEDKPDLVALAKQGLELVELSDSFAVKDIEVTLGAEYNATAMVRANGEVSLRGSGGRQRVPTLWRTTWKRNNESWQLSGATRLNPVNGKELGPFSAE